MAEEKKQYETQKDGSAWTKEGKNGQFFSLSINVDGVEKRFNMFKVKEKRFEKSPDYIIFKCKPREGVSTEKKVDESTKVSPNLPSIDEVVNKASAETSVIVDPIVDGPDEVNEVSDEEIPF